MILHSLFYLLVEDFAGETIAMASCHNLLYADSSVRLFTIYPRINKMQMTDTIFALTSFVSDSKKLKMAKAQVAEEQKF